MKNIKIQLKKEERKFLKDIAKKGKNKARTIVRANILLLADKGKENDEIVSLSNVHRQTVWRTKKRYVEEGLKSALEEKCRPGQPRKYTDKHKAEIIALACTTAPTGRKRWTIRLLAEKVSKKQGLKTMNRETVRLVLKKTKLSLG